MKRILQTTALLTLLSPLSATITLYTTGRQYPSRPATFGMTFEYGLQYEALLQVVEGDEYLCHGTNDTMEEEWSPGFVVGRHDGGRHTHRDGGIENVRELHKNTNGNTTDDVIHVVPSNGVPGKFVCFFSNSTISFYFILNDKTT